MNLKLIAVGGDAKTVKGEKFGWLTGIMYLAPVTEAGMGNVCPNASAGCRVACLYTSGHGAMSRVKAARIRKTRLFFTDKQAFFDLLVEDFTQLLAYGKKQDKKVCVRLNGTSDIPWERLGVFDTFNDVQFYDYTKSLTRAVAFAKGELPANYHLTFSRSEVNEKDTLEVLNAGGNAAVVFGNGLPMAWNGFSVIDSDISDLRFLDGKGVVVGLKAKGEGKKDGTGFVVYS